MTVRDIAGYLDCKVLCDEALLDNEVRSACGSDLMSDVLAFVKDKAALLTGLINTHVVRTAEMLDIVCIIFSRGKIPSQEILDMAKESEIAVLTTTHTMYTACGILYEKGLPGNGKKA